MRLLIVEDDQTIRDALTIGLRRDGFDVRAVADGPSALASFYREAPDLVVLDVMLPGVGGIEVCRAIRSSHTTPVVMLTALSDTEDVLAGLEAGADDYVAKPFDLRELIARLHAVLRRSARDDTAERLRVGDLHIDLGTSGVTSGGVPVTLTGTEYRLLLELARNAGIVRSRNELLSTVWDYSWSGDTRLVDVHIQRLRQKIGADRIETVRGLGYRLRRA